MQTHTDATPSSRCARRYGVGTVRPLALFYELFLVNTLKRAAHPLCKCVDDASHGAPRDAPPWHRTAHIATRTARRTSSHRTAHPHTAPHGAPSHTATLRTGGVAS